MLQVEVVIVVDGEADHRSVLLGKAHRHAGARVEDACPGESRHFLGDFGVVEGEIAGPEFAPGRFIAFERIADDEGHGQAPAASRAAIWSGVSDRAAAFIRLSSWERLVALAIGAVTAGFAISQASEISAGVAPVSAAT